MITDARSLWELIERRVAETPNTTMLVDEDLRTVTYREYRDATERAAAGLAELGVGEDTPGSWALPTWIESLVLVGALSRRGAAGARRSDRRPQAARCRPGVARGAADATLVPGRRSGAMGVLHVGDDR